MARKDSENGGGKKWGEMWVAEQVRFLAKLMSDSTPIFETALGQQAITNAANDALATLAPYGQRIKAAMEAAEGRHRGYNKIHPWRGSAYDMLIKAHTAWKPQADAYHKARRLAKEAHSTSTQATAVSGNGPAYAGGIAGHAAPAVPGSGPAYPKVARPSDASPAVPPVAGDGDQGTTTSGIEAMTEPPYRRESSGGDGAEETGGEEVGDLVRIITADPETMDATMAAFGDAPYGVVCGKGGKITHNQGFSTAKELVLFLEDGCGYGHGLTFRNTAEGYDSLSREQLFEAARLETGGGPPSQ